MARYDGARGWPGRGGMYDDAYRGTPPAWGGRGGYGGGEPGGARYDRGFAGQEGWRGATMEGVYGPSRYGLGPYHERLRRHHRDDSELKEEVEEALFYDTWVDAEAITVEVKDGVVTLRGELPDYEEVRYATDDAWDVDGVLGVRSELRVRER